MQQIQGTTPWEILEKIVKFLRRIGLGNKKGAQAQTAAPAFTPVSTDFLVGVRGAHTCEAALNAFRQRELALTFFRSKTSYTLQCGNAC